MRQGALPHKKTRTGHASQRASGSTVQGAATHPVVSSHTTSTLEDEARRPALTNGRAGLMESSCESEITPIVDLLKYVAPFILLHRIYKIPTSQKRLESGPIIRPCYPEQARFI
jgi:hypothetical protein